MRWNLLHYGRIQNRLAANDARLGQLIARYEQTVLEANAEADSAINRFLTARQETEYRRRAAVVAEEALAMAQTKYEAGETDYLPLLTANVTLAQAQDDLARVEGKTAEALVMVYKALGGGWQVRCQGETIATSFEPLPAPQQP